MLCRVISEGDAILVFRVDKGSSVYGCLKEVKISHGSVIAPASAVAAAVSGDARHMNPSVLIIPLKLWSAVDSAYASKSEQHMIHIGTIYMQFATSKLSRRK